MTPVHDGEPATGASFRAQDVPPLGDRLAEVLDEYAALADRSDTESASARDAAAELFELLATMTDHEWLTHEVTHLRRALKTRPVIDQAKGILMAQQHCDENAAFAALRKMSQDDNVPLADVAAAIVYQTVRSTD